MVTLHEMVRRGMSGRNTPRVYSPEEATQRAEKMAQISRLARHNDVMRVLNAIIAHNYDTSRLLIEPLYQHGHNDVARELDRMVLAAQRSNGK